jgi:hypothetical protein
MAAVAPEAHAATREFLVLVETRGFLTMESELVTNVKYGCPSLQVSRCIRDALGLAQDLLE